MSFKTKRRTETMEKRYYVVIQHGYQSCWFGRGESLDEALRNAAEYLEMTEVEALQAFYRSEKETQVAPNFLPDQGPEEVRILDGRRGITDPGLYLMECTERFFQDADDGAKAFSITGNVVDLDEKED
jgi:predicted RNase H-like HicB family nuclease